MLPPSMIRNVSNSAHRSAGTSNSSTSRNNQLKSSVAAHAGAQQQARRIVSSSNTINNNNNRDDLLRQLRLIQSQMSGSLASPITSCSPATQTPPPISISVQHQRAQPPQNIHQTTFRPEVPKSNVGIATTATAVNRNTTRVGTMAKNPIDVDMATSSNSIGTNNGPAASGNDLFPYILHGMLDDVERIVQTNIVSWNADCKSFRIHDPDAFVSYILVKYFKKYVGGIASRLTQFRSDLIDWGFEDVVDGNRMGETFTHHCFQKGQANLCRYMRCGRKAVEPTRQQLVTSTPANNAVSTMRSVIFCDTNHGM
jgi:hypothetical protein